MFLINYIGHSFVYMCLAFFYANHNKTVWLIKRRIKMAKESLIWLKKILTYSQIG